MADNVGNRLGPRATFEYTTDSGEVVTFTQDESIGLAVGNTRATTAARPTSVNSRYLKGRYILCQLESDPRVTKRIVVGNPDALVYDTDASTQFIINGQTFVTTGRVGEQVSFLRITPGVDPG